MEEENRQPEEEKTRRRGPPYGNQNARVHGFYSKVLTQAEQDSLEDAEDVDGVDAEIALLRVKIKSIVENDPSNIELIAKAVTALTKMLMARNSIGRDRGGLRQAVIEALKELVPLGVGIGRALKK